ncbi:MAG: phosphotransferase [Bacteroidales bacterium]|nr:phosphotransferase [Bacteroidales bacterium]
MENILSIKESIINLINNTLSENIIDIKMLPASGSSRVYFRIFTETETYIATYNSNVEENKAFFVFTKHFKEKKLPVPELIAISDDKCCYIQSDLGDTCLFDYIKVCVKNKIYDETTISLYKQSIDNLIDFQIKGNDGLDYSTAYPTPSFNKNSIIDDLNYFKYYFLKVNEEINFNETRLNNDFQRLADYAMQAPSDFFMYRDFQSRNIMIKDMQTYFIDYQGGRKGPLQYDLVSLLYQVKAQLNDELKDELLLYYKDKLSAFHNIEEIQFDKYYNTFVLLRLLQVLGAYGFRGLIQKKQHFLESIPFALKELMSLRSRLDFPFELNELPNVLNQMEMLLPKYNNIENKKLTVVINSFSYKNGGIPEDRSGNGGGFVFDCRALPNPGRYEEYKKLTGEDIEVQDYLNEKEEVHHFFNTAQSIICLSVDNYLERNFKNLFVNFGCTGGQHRSVFFAQKTAEALHEKYPNIKVILNHIVQHKTYVYETE